jgi:hypothetical protein
VHFLIVLFSFRPEVGDFVVALYENEPSRAVVLAIREDKFRVRFIDYGNVHVVHLADVHPLDDKFAFLYSVGVNCALSGVEEVKTAPWSQFAIKTFAQLAEGNAQWDVKVRNSRNNTLEIEVHLAGKFLNEEFVKRCKAGPSTSPQKPINLPPTKTTPPRKDHPQKESSPPKDTTPKKSPRQSPPAPAILSQSAAEEPKPVTKPIPTIPTRRMELGNLFEAMPVVILSPEEFYIQPMLAAEEFGVLSHALEEYYKSHTTPRR